jgi:hypothetical protein
MRLPPAVRVTFLRSRIAVGAIVFAALAICGVIATLPFDPTLVGLATMLVVIWAGDRVLVIGLRRGPRATREITLTGDRIIVVRTGDGHLTAGYVRDASYVGPTITTIVWRPDSAYRSRAEWILPDMLTVEDLRRLRVMLRYSRSADSEGEPASQA